MNWIERDIIEERYVALLVDINMLFDPIYGEEYRDILRKTAETILKANRQIVLRVEYDGITDYLVRDREVWNMEEYLRAISSINSVVKISNTPLSDLPPLPPSLSPIHP